MVLVEVYGGQRSLAFELTTAILQMEILILLGAMASMDDHMELSLLY